MKVDSEEMLMLETLKKIGFRSLSQKKTFVAIRKDKAGVDQEITIEISDTGPGELHERFTCSAWSRDGKSTSANPASTIEGAISTVRWWELG
jgi:hypothetical protein